MTLLLLTIFLVGLIVVWILRKDRKLDPRADHSGLIAGVALLGIIGFGMLVFSYKAIDQGSIRISGRYSSGAIKIYRARHPGYFWFWAGGIYLAGVLSIGLSAGVARKLVGNEA